MRQLTTIFILTLFSFPKLIGQTKISDSIAIFKCGNLPDKVVTVSQTDTLIIGNYKIKLQKTKPFFNPRQKSLVSLPSEYLTSESKEYTLNYKCIDPDEYRAEKDKDGNSYLVILGLSTDTTHTCEIGSMKFANIVDSIYLRDIIFNSVTPHIKSQKKAYYLCSAILYRLKNDTLTKCTIDSPEYPLDVNFGLKYSYNEALKENLYVLTEIYYRKGWTTYYLDKSIVIKINNR